MPSIQHVDRGRGLFYKHRTSAVPLTWSCCLQVTSSCLLLSYVQQGHSLLCMLLVKSCSWRKSCLLAGGRMQKNFHIGKFFERARRRSLRLDITTRAIGVERSFLYCWFHGTTASLAHWVSRKASSNQELYFNRRACRKGSRWTADRCQISLQPCSNGGFTAMHAAIDSDYSWACAKLATSLCQWTLLVTCHQLSAKAQRAVLSLRLDIIAKMNARLPVMGSF